MLCLVSVFHLKYGLQLQRMTLWIWKSTSWILMTASVKRPSSRSRLITQVSDMPLWFMWFVLRMRPFKEVSGFRFSTLCANDGSQHVSHDITALLRFILAHVPCSAAAKKWSQMCLFRQLTPTVGESSLGMECSFKNSCYLDFDLDFDQSRSFLFKAGTRLQRFFWLNNSSSLQS